MPFVVGEVDARIKGALKNRHGVTGFRVTPDAASWECGIGALMPWVQARGSDVVPVLYVNTYLAENNQGSGSGLFAIDVDRNVELVHQHNCCHAGRFIHKTSEALFIGNSRISKTGVHTEITAFNAASGHRVTAITEHLTTPTTHVLFLTMAGLVFSVNVSTLAATQVANFYTGLGLSAQPHFKGAYTPVTGTKRLYVSNNTDYPNGRLASWDGATYTSLASLGGSVNVDGSGTTPIGVGLVGPPEGLECAALYMIDNAAGTLRRFRLPLPTQAYASYLNQEWMRMRHVESDRWLLDAYGMFYEMGQQFIGTGTFAGGQLYPYISPICRHLKQIGDFAVFDGNLVFGGNMNASSDVALTSAGQSQGGLLWGSIDDLWSWGKPTGKGFLFKGANAAATVASEVMLMTGFEHKALHIRNGSTAHATFTVETIQGSVADIEGELTVPAGGYDRYVFPDGVSADWVRITPQTTVNPLTAWMTYT